MACSMCGGPLVILGTLGTKTWTRCRNCGMEQTADGPDADGFDEDRKVCRDCHLYDATSKAGRCGECQAKADRRNARARANRAAMSAALDSVGARRVRGALGGSYIE